MFRFILSFLRKRYEKQESAEKWRIKSEDRLFKVLENSLDLTPNSMEKETGITTGSAIEIESKHCENCGIPQLLYGDGIEQFCKLCGYKIV